MSQISLSYFKHVFFNIVIEEENEAIAIVMSQPEF